MIRLYVIIIALASLVLVALSAGYFRAQADSPFDGLLYDDHPSVSAQYVFIDGAPMANDRPTIYYNPAGAPPGASEAKVIAALAWWDAAHADLDLIYGGTTTAGPSLFAGQYDGKYVIAWGDRPGSSILASAIFTPTECDIEIDTPHDWTQVKLTTVLAHELGHCIGLHHSNYPEALMAPSYNHGIAGLHADDIAGARALYGSAPATATPTRTLGPTQTPTPVPTATAVPLVLYPGWNITARASGDPMALRVTGGGGTCPTVYFYVNGQGAWLLWSRTAPAYVNTLPLPLVYGKAYHIWCPP
ncbi:MAG: matrixin family metalloprotease [Burkholderiaceae bacterium]